jgi:hypothetical protein
MDQLRIPAARSGAELARFNEPRTERRSRNRGAQSEIAKYSRAINAAAKNQHVQRFGSQAFDLELPKVGHTIRDLPSW